MLDPQRCIEPLGICSPRVSNHVGTPHTTTPTPLMLINIYIMPLGLPQQMAALQCVSAAHTAQCKAWAAGCILDI